MIPLFLDPLAFDLYPDDEPAPEPGDPSPEAIDAGLAAIRENWNAAQRARAESTSGRQEVGMLEPTKGPDSR